MDLFFSFDFAAARRLPYLPDAHPCSRLHGHTFMVRLVLQGEVDATTGWVVDFGAVQDHVERVRGRLDHRFLNDIEGLENPTTERLAEWLWRELAGLLPGLGEISVQEHPSRGVTYRGPG
ncbi:MAG: 6-carboxytetrahydropterin synthase QueD [Gammaproteobacteria bacterium]|jgi:6-pyruvoyltetrahydropterin/6-carboxytetrahydropterin synthase